jgi:hypothetical protein
MTNYNPARIPAAVNGVLAAQFEFVEWTPDMSRSMGSIRPGA